MDTQPIRAFLEKEGFKFKYNVGNWIWTRENLNGWNYGEWDERGMLADMLRDWLEGWLGVYWYELWRLNEVKQVILLRCREERYDSIDAAYQWYQELKSVADTTQKDG